MVKCHRYYRCIVFLLDYIDIFCDFLVFFESRLPKSVVERKTDEKPEINLNALLKLIKEYLIDAKSLKEAETNMFHSVNLSHSTLDRHINKMKASLEDISTLRVADTEMLEFLSEM